MSLITPQPPPDHYVWLGRVMNACSMLELQVGLIGWASKNGKQYTDDWMEVAGSAGAAWRLCESQLSEMEPRLASEVRQVLAEAAPIRTERNKFAHAVFTLDATRAVDDQWVLRSARDRDFRPLTEEQGSRLVATANGLSKRAGMLRKRAAAGSRANAQWEGGARRP